MVTVQEIQSIDPYEFEKLVAELWETKGYDTTVRNKTSDKGIYIDAERGGISEKVQVKRYGQNNKIGSGEVREYATIYQQTNTNNVALVTSGEFTDPARELATDLNVNLCSGKELLQQLESSSVDVSEYTDSSQSGHSSTVDMSEMTDKRRASELAEGLSEVTPERLTESYFGEGTTRQSIIEYLDDDETIRQIFTAESEPIAIVSKRSGHK
jgi:restriction system protein